MTEREVVERERAAFFNGAVYGEVKAMMTDAEDFPAIAHNEAARRYPLPHAEKVPA